MNVTTLLAQHILGPAHVGFVVPDIAAAIANAVRLYGLDPATVEYQPAPGVEAPTLFAFFEVGGLRFEYIEPVSNEFKAQLFAEPSGGGGINHVAWMVDDIDLALAALERVGARPGYVTPGGVIDMGSQRMVYMDPASCGGLLIELIQDLA